MKKWKTLKKEDVSPSKWFTVERQTVVLPNGKVLDDYYIGSFGDGIVIVAIDTAGKIILVKEYRQAIGEIMLKIPMGGIEKGDTPQETLSKEIKQELGCTLTSSNKIFDLGKIYAAPSKLTNVAYGFLVTDVVIGEQEDLDISEDIEIHPTDPKAVIEMVINGEITGSASVSFLLLAQRKYPELFKV